MRKEKKTKIKKDKKQNLFLSFFFSLFIVYILIFNQDGFSISLDLYG